MYEFVETDDEIAGIIGHEINHNELGHINKMLRAQKISEKTFGPDFGGIAATIDGILRSPFGKKDEAHCDFKGADLCLKADFNTCDIVTLWNRMSEQEESSDALTEFISSHPLSSQRRDCLKNHLKTNYDISCD
jgi:predicted Zn-dependent protease